MILRAVFWIGLVAVLMPHEPDLGFGRPGSVSFASGAVNWANDAAKAVNPETACEGRAALCEGAAVALDSFQHLAVQGLSDVKAQIEAQRHARGVH